MTTAILVTGGTGVLGRVVVNQLVGAGCDVRVASRRPPPAKPTPFTWAKVDYRSGDGLQAAVADTQAVIHCADAGGNPKMDQRLVDAARHYGAAHLLYISIVGVDRVPLGYYRAKLATERLIQDSGLPWTILRSTQFHDLIVRLWGPLGHSPLVPVPAGTSIQPIDVREVAVRLAELATASPAGRVPDMGGPQVRTATDLVSAYLQARGLRRLVLPIRLPGKAFRAYRQGGHLAPNYRDGRVTFEEFLAERFATAGFDTRRGPR